MQISTTLTQFDIPEVLQTYNNINNFEIHVSEDKNQSECYIFFSSNGLYDPNTSEQFYSKVIKGNRFEWKKNIPNKYGKVILFRDIFKQWYLKGVNSNLDSIDALANFLRQETVGYKVTCVGVSSGGFIASIIGSLIEAERVFNFSGQFDLTHIFKDEVVMRRNPIVANNKDNIQVNKYFNICNQIETSNVPIFYFYPGLSGQDISQAEFVKNIQNVYAFNFKNRKHGLPIWRNNIGELLVLDNQTLIKLHYKSSVKV